MRKSKRWLCDQLYTIGIADTAKGARQTVFLGGTTLLLEGFFFFSPDRILVQRQMRGTLDFGEKWPESRPVSSRRYDFTIAQVTRREMVDHSGAAQNGRPSEPPRLVTLPESEVAAEKVIHRRPQETEEPARLQAPSQ